MTIPAIQRRAIQVQRLKRRFGLDRIVLVAGCGIINQARLTEDIKTASLDWIIACPRRRSRIW